MTYLVVAGHTTVADLDGALTDPAYIRSCYGNGVELVAFVDLRTALPDVAAATVRRIRALGGVCVHVNPPREDITRIVSGLLARDACRAYRDTHRRLPLPVAA